MGRIREFKGHSVNRHVDNYCVLDLETTGVFIYSAEIIEISALKVRNNEVVEEFSTLVNPRCHIPEDATAVNHITDEMVGEAPVIEDIIDDFLEFVNDDIILGYNNAGFDMCLIYDTVQELKNIPFSNDYIDILHAVRRSLPELENSKLETASKHYGFDTQGEHRALKDCYLTKDCYDKLFEEFGDIAFQSRRRSSSGQGVHYSNETLALQELNTLLKGILEDGKVSLIEMDLISDWIGNHRDLSGNYPFDKAFDALDRVLEDGVVTEQELTDLKTIFEEIIDPVRTKCCHDYIGALCGKSVCLTGEFEYGPKSAVEQLIVSADGTVDKTVKKRTSYLVVGAYGSNAWKAGNYGGKIQKAMYWNNKGQDIKIIEESDFIPALLKMENNKEKKHDNCFDNYKVELQNIMNAVCEEQGLFSNSIQYVRSTSKKMPGYIIRIFEEEYPVSDSIPHEQRIGVYDSFGIALIKEVVDTNDVHFGYLLVYVRNLFKNKYEIPTDAEFTSAPNDYFGFYIEPNSDNFMPYLKKLMEHRIGDYQSSCDNFGCCARFEACSDAKRCIHPNLLYSTACIYRMQHLEKGEILYGKNRNID